MAYLAGVGRSQKCQVPPLGAKLLTPFQFRDLYKYGVYILLFSIGDWRLHCRHAVINGQSIRHILATAQSSKSHAQHPDYSS